ncbi:hypothetical protein [Paenibacillus alkalitolerans]|uniref:hypothetical protein n=1 Tax=Paenibacillus alkalitolerans TaxID=2799335 RepID=UPI0018F6BCC0|nr:hypothetical protein [Paenibacillus alkalitolerans]
MAKKPAKKGYTYTIPKDWSTPYDRIFNFTTYDFGYAPPALEKDIWDRIVSRLPASYSAPDLDQLGLFLTKIGTSIKPKEVIDAEFQRVNPRAK